MTDTKKLDALVKKACENGFYSFADGAFGDPEFTIEPRDAYEHSKIYVKGHDKYWSWEWVIFNHGFARALFGGCTDTCTVQNNSLNVKQVIDMNGWRYNLQQAVISDNPIEYMYEIVFGNSVKS